MEKEIETGLVDILILFFNKVDQTISCINSFLPSGQQVYVLNNGSDEQQLRKLENAFQHNSQVHILNAGKNLGVSGGRNHLIQMSTASWLFSVDNDIIIQPTEWLPLFHAYIAQHPGAEVIVPKIYNVHEKAYGSRLRIGLHERKVSVETGDYEISNCFPGGASIIHRNVFEKYGLFDEDMFVGFEDYEYALRAMLSVLGPLEVHFMNAIELIHDHQYQKSDKDKRAVKIRYNEEKLQASYNRLVEKYSIDFDHDWQWWTRKQLIVMTKRGTFFSRVKQYFKLVLL